MGVTDSLNQLGLGIVILIVVVSIGSLIVSETRDNVADETNVINETGLTTTATLPVTLTTDNNDVIDGSESLYTWNETSGAKLGDLTKGTNYSVIDYEAGTFNVSSLGTSGADISVNITYDYLKDNNATSVLDDGQDALLDLTGWLGIIVVATIGSLVIGLIVVGFNRFGGTRNGF